MLDFEKYYQEEKDVEIESLMPLPDTAHIRMSNGEIEECDCGQYMIDAAGKTYEYLFDLGVAAPMNDCEARSENNMPVRFRDKDAVEIEVVPVEFVIDRYG